jgi:hypothetical protein
MLAEAGGLWWTAALLFCILLGLVGVVLLIIGLIKKKTGIWIGGLAVVILFGAGALYSGVMLAQGAFDLGKDMWNKVKADEGGGAELSALEAEAFLRGTVGEPLPSGAKFLRGVEIDPALDTTHYYMKLKTGPGFDAWLRQAGFERIETETDRLALPPELREANAWWAPQQAQLDEMHRIETGSAERGGWTVLLGYNADIRRAFIAARQFVP